MLSLKAHNVLDYLIAAILVLAPFLFGFSNVPLANNLFLSLGLILAIYSLFTKYYYSIAKIIPIGAHMTLDLGLGLLLLVAPFVFNYRDQLTYGSFMVHVILGVGTIGFVALTRTRTEDAKTPEEKFETQSTRRPRQTSPLR